MDVLRAGFTPNPARGSLARSSPPPSQNRTKPVNDGGPAREYIAFVYVYIYIYTLYIYIYIVKAAIGSRRRLSPQAPRYIQGVSPSRTNPVHGGGPARKAG